MDAPVSARVWKRYWFACPYCGFRMFEAHAFVQAELGARRKTVLLYSFWCASCHRYSRLAHPLLFTCTYWAVAIAIFALVYCYLLPLGWLIIVPALTTLADRDALGDWSAW